MDKIKEEAYQKEISDLKLQNKEFADKAMAQKAADEKAAADKAIADQAVADAKLFLGVKQFCAENKLNTNKHQELNIEGILYAAAKANSTVEFSSKDKDGKDVSVKKPLLEVLQSTIKAFQLPSAPVGELGAEFAEDGKKKDGRSELIQKVDEYIKNHPSEFAKLSTEQARAKVITLEANHKITLM